MSVFILGLILGAAITLYVARGDVRSSVNRAIQNGINSINNNRKKTAKKRAAGKNRNTEGIE